MQKQTAKISLKAQATGARLDRADDTRWAAFVARDASQAGAFYMGVQTTGIYCRPGCPARLPNRSNVTFFDTTASAEAAGFRACLRCKPKDAPVTPHSSLITAACRRLENADTPPALAELAMEAGLSPYHFHRVFKAATGLTPKAYAVAHRRQRVRRNLTRSETVTDAIYDSGFNSNASFYADSPCSLGMTPGQFRSGAADVAIQYDVTECLLGRVLVAASPAGICAIFLGDEASQLVADLKAQFPHAQLSSGDAGFAALTRRAVALVDAPESRCDLPLDIRGTAFQHRVWQALRDIPAGETRTYAQVAEEIGSPKAVRAVGTACGANAISVAIPCHRVVRSDGTFPQSNYRWGGDRKAALLDREAKARKR